MAVDLTGVTPSQEAADELFPPTDIGPIWKKDDQGRWLMPERTIGLQAAIWAEENLGAIEGTGRLQLTNEQVRILAWMYALDDDGDWLYPNVFYQAFKGAGKDPFAAVVCLIELVGPCRFSHWDENGNPVAREEPDAWVQLLAVSKDQTRNTMKMFPKLVTKQLKERYTMDVQKEIIYADHGRRTLYMSGSASQSAEGNRVTFVLANETQHWTTSNGGRDLWDTVFDNVGKTYGSRIMQITNAYAPGQDSVAETIRTEQEKVWAGLASPSGWLYMSREAHPEAPLDPEWVPFIMERIIGDAWWQRRNIKSLVTRVLDGSRPPSRTRRMYYNQIVTSESQFFTPDEWDGAKDPGAIGDLRDLRRGDEIVLGFDGSKTDDATALVAIRIKDKLIVPVLVEQKPEGPQGEHWHVDQDAFDEAVAMCFAEYTVKAFYADVNLWESYIAKWSELYGEQLEVSDTSMSKVAFDMRQSKEKISRLFEAYRQAIRDKTLKHNGDPVLRVHALNAQMGHNGKGLIARKEKRGSPRKIDCMVASYVAFAALSAWIEKGKKKTQYRRRMLRSSQYANH
ncbi:terminase large subunit [Nesterenkonia sp. CL21]|uniref:terminase TerL endonuclease subunit n=1 Tax=Nesterenkonia sp. CL21 TaxID=3064894 RepID=UPI002878A6AD|nr:terminase TerL endonuclease subunit [Nesterenkonia sp. CL21]MDS2171619.1 terminase large subunit [Nesterenkonia sp. CL21]